tara:strand:+ start:757 stop:1383 length:627 start_codon:yes stop_codon:yes gene_type:complete
MEKKSLSKIIQDLKSKRDALSLAHEQLKKDNDDWNKTIIILSLSTGMFESMKIKMDWTSNVVALVPIFLSSVIASVSALIKFKKFPEQMEVILQAQSLLTHTLNNARNQSEVSQALVKEYNDALEKLETSIYPDTRKRFLKISHTNLVSILKQETLFFNALEKARKGLPIDTPPPATPESTSACSSLNGEPITPPHRNPMDGDFEAEL